MEKMRALSNYGSSSVSEGIVADLRPKARLPLSPLTSCHADELGGAEGVEAVHEGDADVDFGGLAGSPLSKPARSFGSG